MDTHPSIPELGAARTLIHFLDELRHVSMVLEMRPPDPVRAQILAAARSAHTTLEAVTPLLPGEVQPPR